MNSSLDTIAAIATPLGEGGLGVIRISGSQAIPAIKSIFKPAHPIDLAKAASHTCHFGKIVDNNTILDQVVVTFFQAPHSYTGEDVLEISAHGSPFVLQQILRLCLRNGARLAGPGEFTERAFLNGKMDLTQAEAVADLIRARTDKAQAAAVAQLEGHLARHVRALRQSLVTLLAHIEVGLDHSDEDHPFMTREQLVAGCRSVQHEIETMLASARVGKILREGLRVVLAGRPNVGKSSLLNALLKEDRAIVTPIPGTTRDTLEESVDWDGVPVVLVDTAGVRDQVQDPVERLGMERTQQMMEAADVVLCLFDGSEPFDTEDRTLVQQCLAKPHIWVVNKSDLLVRFETQALGRLNGRAPLVQVSAKTGEGLKTLVEQVKTLVFQGDASFGQAQWTINVRHRAALERAREALEQAVQSSGRNAFEECVALELRTALDALGEVIGETTTEDLLDQIFSKFCVGK